MALFTWQKKIDDKGDEKFELPDEIAKQIKDGAEGAAKISKIETLLADLVSTQQKDKTDREKAAKDAAEATARARSTKSNEDLDAEIEELLLTNPREAIRRATEGQTNAIKAVHADNVRREVFEDQKKFPYYHGDIKREVDALLAGQHVDFRLNQQNIENCYKTVIGGHTDEILEGKLKTRFAGADGRSSTSTGSAGESSTDGDVKNRKFSADYESDIRRAAKQSGIKYEDYIEMLDKEGVI